MYLQARPRHRLGIAVPLLVACPGSPSPEMIQTEPGTGTTGAAESSSSGEPPTSSTDPDATTSTTGSSTSAETTTGVTTGTTGTGGFCGDATVDPDEACDLGPNNRDDGPCTLDCKAAVCGDGKVWADMEECDLAGDNNNAYAGCSPLCQKNAHCGDSVVDIPFEQCDAGPANGSGESDEDTVPCTLGCNWDGRLAFLSSALYDGDLGGLDGADQKCRTLGEAAGIPRWQTLMAWISSGELGPLDRFVLIPAKPYLLPTGERIADSLSDLVLDGPSDGIRVDESGKPLPSSKVWTNTSVIGEPYSPVEHCSTWDDAMSDLGARVGRSHVPHQPEDEWQAWQADKQWTSFEGRECFALARLYCFEQ